MENSAILCRRKVTIMRKKRQIMQKFLKLIKLFPWLFSTYKIYVNVLPRILVLYDMFDILLPFVDRYFFVQRSLSKLSNQPLNRTRKTGNRKKKLTQAHHQKTNGTPGGLKLFTNKKRVFVGIWKTRIANSRE